MRQMKTKINLNLKHTAESLMINQSSIRMSLLCSNGEKCLTFKRLKLQSSKQIYKEPQ